MITYVGYQMTCYNLFATFGRELISTYHLITMKDPNTIIIELADSSNTQSFYSKEKNDRMIHSRELDIIKKHIKQNLDNIGVNNTKRYQDTISILGGRGSGKSSFLMSISDYYKQEHTIQVLDIIDPTLIENKGHVLLTIISMIQDLVQSKYKSSSCHPENSQQNICYKQWNDQLQELAYGLPTIEDEHKVITDSWIDPDFIMQKGLKSVKTAKNLEQNFHKLIRLSLKVLDKKAFILFLDDIDVDFKKGWPVLETLRKYITIPELITFVSGDIDLFSKAVRKKQWANFGKALLINEADRQNKTVEYNDLVTNMENQYLQKVLKPERRIRLKNLYEIVKVNNTLIKIGGELIEDHYRKIFRKYGMHNPTQVNVFVSYLLNLPIRSQIQFLLGHETEDKQVDISSSFLSDMYEKNINVDMFESSPLMGNIIILDLLLREKMLVESYQLLPTTTDESLNASLTALNLILSNHILLNPYLIFDYFIRIGFTRNIAFALDYQNQHTQNQLVQEPSIENLVKFSELKQDKVLRDVMGNINSYLKATSIKNGVRYESNFGQIPIYVLGSDAKDKVSIDKAVETQDCYNASPYLKYIAYMPLSIASPSNKSYSYPIYSIYTLLATICEILKCDTEREIKMRLYELSQIRSYAMPNLQELVFDSTDVSHYEETPTDELQTNDAINKLTEKLLVWKNSFPEKDVMSFNPYLLGKISTRLFSAIKTIEEEEREETNWNLGKAMHYRVVTLYNAVLVESLREMEHIRNVNNTVLSSKNFINNFNYYTSFLCESNKFPSWIISCPLLLAFLDQSDTPNGDCWETISHHLKISNGMADDDTKNYPSLFPILENVTIKGYDNQTNRVIINNDNKFYVGKTTYQKTIIVLKEKGFSFKQVNSSKIDQLKSIFSNPGKVTNQSITKFINLVKQNRAEW